MTDENFEAMEKKIFAMQGETELFFNRNASKAISKPVQCLETKTVFQSARDAARKMNLSYVGIGKVCLGKCKTTRGYHFRFMENLNVH